MDWAREIAEKLEVGIEGQGPEQFIAAMSAQLRKAKASGMRQAISIIRMQDGFKAPLVEAFEKVDAVAAEIEKGSQ